MPPENSGGIQRRTSSFLSSPGPKPPAERKKKKIWPPEDEIIPDSEEERINEENARKGFISTEEDSDPFELSSSPAKRPRLDDPTVIVISSDSDEEIVPRKSQARKETSSSDPFIDKDASSSGEGATRPTLTPSTSSPKPPSSNKGKAKAKAKARTPLPRFESSDDSDVICISDVETDYDTPPLPPPPSGSPVKQKIVQRTLTPYEPILNPYDLDIPMDDPAILTFDPHVRAKPVPRTPSVKSKTPVPSRGLPAPASTPAPTPSTSKLPKKRKAVPTEQLRLEAYARALFDELNASVFKGRMPPDTELMWNVRLLSTAGRAFLTKHRDGRLSTKIELSSKVVDCDERVRHTLAHEMCHLAVWVLDGDMGEQGHGRQFKAWSSLVTKSRPDITISTKHTYDINYKFQWECVACGKVYGRHSDSIDIEKSACGVCNPPGRLKPLFQKRARRTPKAASGSKLASGSPRESPRSLDRPPRSPAKSPTKSKSTLATPVPRRPFPNSDLTDEDDDVEELIKGLGGVAI